MASTNFNDSAVYHRHELNVREDISLMVSHYKRKTSNNTLRSGKMLNRIRLCKKFM